jgi:hypothetical protein
MLAELAKTKAQMLGNYYNLRQRLEHRLSPMLTPCGEDKFLVMSRKGEGLGVAFASTPRGESGAGFLRFKTK